MPLDKAKERGRTVCHEQLRKVFAQTHFYWGGWFFGVVFLSLECPSRIRLLKSTGILCCEKVCHQSSRVGNPLIMPRDPPRVWKRSPKSLESLENNLKEALKRLDLGGSWWGWCGRGWRESPLFFRSSSENLPFFFVLLRFSLLFLLHFGFFC